MRHRNEWIKRPMGDDRRPENRDAVAEFIDRLRSESTSDGPAPEGLARLLAAEARSAAQLAAAHLNSGRIGPLPVRKWRKPVMISAFLSTLLGKLAVAGVALAASTGGLAATGNLPDPAQAWASEALSNIGIEIPDPNDVELADQAEGVEVSEVEAPVLPEEAADTAKDVTDSVFEGDPSDGRGYGESVADAAKADNADVADQYTEDAGSQADDGADNADAAEEYAEDAGSQADDGADNADAAEEYTEDAGSQADDGAEDGEGPPADFPNGPPQDGGPPAGLP